MACGPPAAISATQRSEGQDVSRSGLLAPTRLVTTPEELEKALEEHETIVIALVATP